MKNITNLTKKTIEKLQDIIKYEPKYRPRKRAEAILLSHKGKTVKEIVNILDIKKQALYEWFKKYEEDGVEGVYDKGGKGRKLSLGSHLQIHKKAHNLIYFCYKKLKSNFR